MGTGIKRKHGESDVMLLAEVFERMDEYSSQREENEKNGIGKCRN